MTISSVVVVVAVSSVVVVVVVSSVVAVSPVVVLCGVDVGVWEEVMSNVFCVCRMNGGRDTSEEVPSPIVNPKRKIHIRNFFI